MQQPAVRGGAKTRSPTAGGETTANDDAAANVKRSLADKPPFTMADIKRAIPPHCFRRSVLRSSSYLLRDLSAVAALFYVALVAIPSLPAGGALHLAAWPLYWAAQGCALNSLWVIAHECGHHAFSEHAALDDAVGFALHTALLVPYFSWKHSHRRHHANSASLDRDEVYVPWKRSELPAFVRGLHRNAAVRLVLFVLVLVFGFPLYLTCNITGRPYPRLANHYDPYSPIFSGNRERAQVVLSDTGIVADGTTFWHLFNTWSEIHRSGGRGCELSTPPPVLGRWFPDACPVPVTLPFMKVEDIIQRVEFPPVRECFFHLSTASVRNLKAKANAEMTGTAQPQADPVSSLQAVLAHLWRGACRARRLLLDQETTCLMAVGCRGRVQGVPQHYMGNAVGLGVAKCTVAHVVDKGLGCTAWLLNQAVASFDEAKTRDALASWHQKPHILYLKASGHGEPADIVVAASPRFDLYGNDFGRGTPVAVRSGAANKMDGVVTVYPGRDGGGSIGVEVCMSPEALARLTADREFMEAVDMA